MSTKCLADIKNYEQTNQQTVYWQNDGKNCTPVVGEGAYMDLAGCQKGLQTCNDDCGTVLYPAECTIPTRLSSVSLCNEESYMQGCCNANPYSSLDRTWGFQKKYTL